MALGAISSSAVTLLDVLVSDHGQKWVRPRRVSDTIGMTVRTARRNWARLELFGLVYVDKSNMLRKKVRASPLGQALIDARYEPPGVRLERAAS